MADIIEEIRRGLGEEDAATSVIDDADLVRVINGSGQRLPMRCAQVVGGDWRDGVVRFDMWRTTAASTITAAVGNLVVAAGSATVTFPDDYDQYISFYDTTANRPIEPVTRVSKWHYAKLKEKVAGPPEAIEIGNAATASANRRTATLYPATFAGVTPAIEMQYWRLPAVMPNAAPSSEYPDADVKYHWLWVYGPLLTLLAPGDPAFDRYVGLEKDLLLDLAATARAA